MFNRLNVKSYEVNEKKKQQVYNTLYGYEVMT